MTKNELLKKIHRMNYLVGHLIGALSFECGNEHYDKRLIDMEGEMIDGLDALERFVNSADEISIGVESISAEEFKNLCKSKLRATTGR